MGGKSASLLNASPKLYGSSCRRLKQTRPILHSAKLRQLPTSLAMGHFDHHYPAYYGPRWSSIRLALLCRYKSVAMVNNFANTQKTSDAMESLGCVEMMSVVRSRLDELQIASPVSAAPTDSATDGTTPAAADSPAAARSPPIEVQKSEAEAAGRLRVVRGGADELGALLDHVPASQLYGDDHWLEEGDYFKCVQDSSDMEVVMDKENHLSLPEALKVYCFPPGDISRFPNPETDAFGLTDYYPFDAGSLLAVLLLDVRAGDCVLDMCAAPGGKSLAVLQTLRPKLLVCNDVQSARLKRLTSVLNQYLPQEADRPTEVRITRQRGETVEERAFYDQVLVDVPCFADRHSLASEDNNIFSIGRSRERILIPELQTNLLRSAMIAVRPGGTVVYSTCTLSPVQNDGVVHMALRRVWEETGIRMVVKDTGACMRAFHPFMWTAHGVGLRYGQQVLPSMSNNFGPTYVAKLVRVN